jgi:ketosteroid isomerase-like protein
MSRYDILMTLFLIFSINTFCQTENQNLKMKDKIILDFIGAINRADVDGILNIITDDHILIDSHDNKMTGKDNLRQAWIGYFELFPDYKIEVNDILEKDSLICILGYASGTYKNLKNKDNSNYWKIPVAWTAIIKDNHIKQWQIYADNIIVMDIINKNI